MVAFAHPMIFSWPKEPAKDLWAAIGCQSIFSWPPRASQYDIAVPKGQPKIVGLTIQPQLTGYR